jgi:phosphomannomutase
MMSEQDLQHPDDDQAQQLQHQQESAEDEAPERPPVAESYERYCPGEERIKISDAICLGRRRSNFPKCATCKFNDDNAAPPVAAHPVVAGLKTTTSTPQAQAEGRDRVEMVFGHCEVQGIYPDLINEDIAWRVGLAAAQFLKSELRGYDRSEPAKSTVLVGTDMRRSSPELAEALTDGLRTGGSPVIHLGMIDTPQLYFAVNRLSCCGGVQVTSSTGPADWNGFKVCGQKGRPVTSETGLSKMAKIAKNTIKHSGGNMSEVGREDLGDAYCDFLRGFLNRPASNINADKPLKIVIDASNGMAGRWLPMVFDDVDWLQITRLNFDHNGKFAHDPNPLAPDNLKELIERVGKAKADLGVCFDADASSCVFVDRTGQPVRPDLLNALLARFLLKTSPGSTVLYDLRSSRILPESIRKAGGLPRRERATPGFLRKAISDAKGLFAGELNGRYYFRDNWHCESGSMALIHVINLMTETGRPLEDMISPLNRYSRIFEMSFMPDPKLDVLSELSDRYSEGSINYLDGITVIFEDWWFNVRPVDGDGCYLLTMEAVSDRMLEVKLAELTEILGPPGQS